MSLCLVLAVPAGQAAGPSTLGAVQPAVCNDELFGHLPETFADVRKDGADVYDSVAAIRAGTPTGHVGDKTFVAMKPKAKTLTVAGVKYVQTDQGWIARTELSWYSPSTFHGEKITDLSLPAWAYPHRIGVALTLRSAPNRKAKLLGKLAARAVVTIIEVRDGFARLQNALGVEQWLDARNIKQAIAVPRPEGVAADERWLDIDLDKQILVLYRGDAPVFATLISTGKKNWETPTGIYRIVDKRERARMQADGATEQWNVAAVPWTMTFRKNFALHGAYWHDAFGRARSHGCVNLAPADAHRTFVFVTVAAPVAAPVATATIKQKAPALGVTPPIEALPLPAISTAVQLRRGKEQKPAWRDYQGALIPLLAEKPTP
ncbi:MAG: L,D-transpeptidase family protein [Kofleriaceae bacterium]|nr:L,D-transpeptidase family protein [Kofleriaceae bacterium]